MGHATASTVRYTVLTRSGHAVSVKTQPTTYHVLIDVRLTSMSSCPHCVHCAWVMLLFDKSCPRVGDKSGPPGIRGPTPSQGSSFSRDGRCPVPRGHAVVPLLAGATRCRIILMHSPLLVSALLTTACSQREGTGGDVACCCALAALTAGAAPPGRCRDQAARAPSDPLASFLPTCTDKDDVVALSLQGSMRWMRASSCALALSRKHAA